MDVKDTVISGRPLQGYYPAAVILGGPWGPHHQPELIRSWSSELDSGVKRQGRTEVHEAGKNTLMWQAVGEEF